MTVKARIEGFWMAMGFLTTLPVQPVTWSPERWRDSLRWYPVVGMLIGSLLWVVAELLGTVFPPVLTGALLVAVWVMLTGGLHLDGLADTVDGWMAGRGDRERTLTVMKDPHIGAMGAMSLVVVLMIKAAALVSLIPHAHALALALWLSPLIARSLAPVLLSTTPYVRPSGLGHGLSGPIPRPMASLAALAVMLPCGILGSLPLMTVVIITQSLLLWAWRQILIRRLGGTTGDTAGALLECSETLTLIVIAGFAHG